MKTNFRSCLLALLLAFVMTGTCEAYDHIIFRSGRESDVKLYQINNDKIIFGYIGDSTGTQHEVDSKDVYMVYIEKQGNVYITPDGKRITGEMKRVDPKRNDVIYLVKGMEIAAFDVRITEDAIRYSVANRASNSFFKKNNEAEATLEKSEVFMIRYRSGMVDIITPIEIKEEEVKTDTVAVENAQPQYVVVFHAVDKGDNLQKIAAKYNVTQEQIVEWNDLSTRIKPTTPLTVGMQLMIYQPKQSK